MEAFFEADPEEVAVHVEIALKRYWFTPLFIASARVGGLRLQASPIRESVTLLASTTGPVRLPKWRSKKTLRVDAKVPPVMLLNVILIFPVLATVGIERHEVVRETEPAES